jgi:acetamidase/formamidase
MSNCGPAHLASTPDTVRWGRLPSAGAPPVLVLEDGGVVTIDTVSHEGILPDQGQDPVGFFGSLGIPAEKVLPDATAIAAAGLRRDPTSDGPHVVTGPIMVRGARPGDLLRVETLRLDRRADYGIVSNRHGKGVLIEEFPGAEAGDGRRPLVVSHLARVDSDGVSGWLSDPTGRRIRFSLREFLGLVGVTPAVDDELPSTPPGPYGGNLDIRRLGVGTSLLLPVMVEGAGLYVGDPHFAQGNGEVALTAFEAPLSASLRVTVERGADARSIGAAIGHPIGETDRELIAVGIGVTLDDAMAAAVRHAVILVQRYSGLEAATALAFLSAAADFEVSQAVNGVRGVHCVIAKRDLGSVTADGPTAPTRYVGTSSPQGGTRR